MQPRERILITGSDGFCASRLCAHLNANHTVIALNRKALDITDREACLRAVAELKPTVVVHTAAIADMRACEADPDLSFRVNVLAPEYLALACNEVHAKLIHFSSDQVYSGTAQNAPHREDAVLAPQSVYGRQKQEAEARIQSLAQRYAALRLTWMYDFPARNLRTNYNLLTICLRSLYTGALQTMPSQTPRGITYVWEVAENLPTLFHAPNGVYNFGSAGDVSMYEAAREIYTLLGAQRHMEELLHAEGEPAGKYADLRMDGTKAAQAGVRFSSTKEGIVKAFAQYGWPL